MKTLLIAEIAQAHDGSLGQVHAFIDSLRDSGVQIIKFQTHIAEAESSEHEPFRIPFSFVDKTRKDYWKRMEFTFDQWKEIKSHCEEAGFEFMSSPFSIAAVDLLESLGVLRYKIGSGEINNYLLLDKIAQTKKPMILSTGLSNWDEVDAAVVRIKKYHNSISILQCTTAYPTRPEQIELPNISTIRMRYQTPSGLSDHSGTLYSLWAATALGADILEFHICFDRNQFGPDSKASITIHEVFELVKGVDFIEKALQVSHDKQTNENRNELRNMFGKSLAINKNCEAEHVIQFNDLETKKPSGHGIPATDYEKIIGKKLNKKLIAFSFINWSDIYDE